MLRDMIKDENYFNKYIAYQNERIAKFENILTQNSLEESKIKQCNEYLANYRLDLIKAKYSIGANFDEVKSIFLEFLENTKNSGELTYNNGVDTLSLAIIFDSDVSFIYNKIVDKDDVIKFLYEFACNKTIIYVNECMFSDIYLEFINVIKTKNEDLLIKYMQDDWYHNNINTSWYDSHNLTSEVYCGYFCFIAVAIIKALNFDIKKFSNVRFLPIDLIK